MAVSQLKERFEEEVKREREDRARDEGRQDRWIERLCMILNVEYRSPPTP